MKKCILILLAVLLLAGCAAAAEGEAWICSACGAGAAGNFCSNCGAGRPAAETEASEADNLIRLDLDIAFEKNAYFSTYDVRLSVDDEWIATLCHGTDYAGTVYVTPGKHILQFRADGVYPAEGSAVIRPEGHSAYHCRIHAKYDAVQISGERLEAIAADRPAPDAESELAVDGDVKLRVSVGFKKNGLFSTYDVDLYLDDLFIARLPHGKDFEQTLLVSPGQHLLVFYKAGGKSVRGTASFQLDGDAFFSCRIEAERNKIDVKNVTLTH